MNFMELKGNYHNSSRVITKGYFQLGSQYNHILLLQVPLFTAMSARFMLFKHLQSTAAFTQIRHYFYNHSLYYLVFQDIVARDSVVNTTCYGLNIRGIESRSERGFLDPSRPVPGPIQPTIQQAQDHSYSDRDVAITTHTYPKSSLKKEYSYTRTTPLGLRCLLQGKIYLYLYVLKYFSIVI